MRARYAAPVLALLVGCTHLPWHPYRGWRVFAGDHVVLYADTLSEHQLTYQYLHDSFDLMQRTFFHQMPVPALTAIYIPPNEDTPLRTDAGTKKFGATFDQLPGALIADGRHLMTVGRYAHISPYAHLVAHHFVHSTMPTAPVWLHEGLAVYLSVFQSHPTRRDVMCFGLAPPQRMNRHVTMDLRQLLATPWGDYNHHSAPWVAPTAWALIDYLLHGEGGKRRTGFRSLLLAFAGGLSGEQALRTAYPDLSLDDLDTALRAHMRSLRQPGDQCPLAVPLGRAPAGVHVVGLPPPEAADERQVRSVFEALERVPSPAGYADFYQGTAPGR
jgi:hypothetical protein